jgi:hypothetical protein
MNVSSDPVCGPFFGGFGFIEYRISGATSCALSFELRATAPATVARKRRRLFMG